MGAQSYSFRHFDLEGAIGCLKQLGLQDMEFCGVHFPANREDPGFENVKRILAAHGVRVPVYGVVGFGGDASANRAKFEFAQALGIGVLSADPAPESFDSLEKLCEEFQVRIAIHNHGPGARYDKVADTLAAVQGRTPLIGACVDTGHSIRSGEKPHEVIQELGSRVLALHLKDWAAGGEEQRLGEGDMELAAVAHALRDIQYEGPIVMEYELEPENPVPGMQAGWNRWREVWR